MKTQVIQLDPHDDVISVRDKMSWVKASRLLLVFPRRGQILARSLDLQLLQRHALHLGVQIALVTPSPEIRRTASGLGIPVFESAATAQRRNWKAGDKKRELSRHGNRPDLRKMRRNIIPIEAHWQTLPAVRLGLFSLAVLTVLTLMLLFIPSATVILKPKTQTQRLNLEVSASPDYKSVNLAGNLPAQTTAVDVAGSKTISSSGSAQLPDQPAAGMLRFRNLTTRIIGIPSGTVVRTVGGQIVRFATIADGVIPGGVGNTVDVPVQALEGGPDGNLPADSLIAIEGDLGTSLAATNPEPTIGGTERTAAVPTANDREKLHAALLAELRQKALLLLPGTLAEGDVFFPDSLAVSQVLSETYIPAEGQSGDLVTLNIHILFQIQYAKDQDIKSLVKAVMDASMVKGFTPEAADIQTHSLTTPTTGTDGVSHWQLLAERPLRPQVDSLLLAQMIQGLRIPKARQKLALALSLDSTPDIQLAPSWWPWMPWLSFRTMIVVK